MRLTLILILLCTAGLTWWLSGYDSKVTGHDPVADFWRRFLRCSLTLIIVGLGADQFLKGGIFGGFVCVVLMLPLAPFWMGCVSEVSSGGVMHLVDRPDDREFSQGQGSRELDQLAKLVRHGRHPEAIDLGSELLQSNEVSTMAVETMLFEIYAEMFSDERLAQLPALAEVQQLVGVGHCDEAVARLEELLRKTPDYVAAAFLLMQIHAQHLQQPQSARRVLQSLARRPSMPPAFDAYVMRRIEEWTGAVPLRQKTEETVESLLMPNRPPAAPKVEVDTHNASPDELLAVGHLTSAIEILEQQTRTQPQDFDAWLKLAEAHAAYCRDFLRAGKIVDKIAANPAFSPEQIRLAKVKLKEWRSIAVS